MRAREGQPYNNRAERRRQKRSRKQASRQELRLIVRELSK